MSKRFKLSLILFSVGALVPLLWGILGFALFNLPEGALSRLFWMTVYLTCPFWLINGNKALVLMPICNGLLYAGIGYVVSSLKQGLKKEKH